MGNTPYQVPIKIVQEKYITKKEKDQDEIQKSKLKKFLENEQIDIGNLIETLGDTYPYSLLDINAKDVEELKKKRLILIDSIWIS